MKIKNQIVYSTNPDFLKEINENYNEKEMQLPSNYVLKVRIEKKHRGGKLVTIVSGYIGPESGLKELEKKLKQKCGVGGTCKNGEIIIQGEHADKVVQLLNEFGYKAKKVRG